MSRSSTVGPAEDRTRRRARVAVSLLFLLNAVFYANLIPRLPEVKDALQLTNTALGAGVAALAIGSLTAGLFAPLALRRFGSASTASVGLVGLAAGVAAVAVAPSWLVFAAVMLAIGAIDAVVDVAQNAHGFRVQRRYGRSIINAFHGLWSVGAVLGGVLGSVAAGLAVPLSWHLGAVGVLGGAVAVAARRWLLDGPDDTEVVALADGSGAPHTPPVAATGSDRVDRVAAVRRATRVAGPRLLVLSVLVVCAVSVEDAGATWGALFVRSELGLAAASAGLAFVSLQVFMTIGRLTGDRVVDRIGWRAVGRSGGALIAAGMLVALAVPNAATTVLGFGLAGFGVATLVPAAMHAADELPGLPAGVGLTIVSWSLRIGVLVFPLLVGVLADAASLRAALSVVVLTGLVATAASSALPRDGVHHRAADGP